MATYKVIQDVEAEDKLVGPLTLRQFVYAIITGTCLYLGYFVVSKGLGILAILFVPPALISGFFAFPWSREQPTELWALARLRFLFKPRKRIWNQSGVMDLVTVNAPKRIEQIYTDGLSHNEVRSRLQALASTIDSRGWAVKGGFPYAQSTDRLVSPNTVTDGNSDTFQDVMDPSNSAVARQFDSMLSSNAQQHRQQLVQSMQQQDTPTAQPATQQTQQNQPAPDYWFMNQVSSGTNMQATHVVSPGTTDDPYIQAADITKEEEQQLVEELKAHDVPTSKGYSHLPTILPLAEQEKLAKQQAAQAAMQQANNYQNASASRMTEQPDAAILELARNDDLNVETIARQAKKAHGDSDEVVISLH